MKIYRNITELIGKTPLLELCHIEKEENCPCRILAKWEGGNPAGSVKDRVAAQMIARAEAAGNLRPGSVIIEPTSGNTGIGLSAIGAAKGYRVIIVMPDSMSVERRLLMGAYGAELVLSDGKLGMRGAMERAEELAATIPGAWIAGQFENPANPLAHELTTGPEIWEDTDGTVDAFIAGIGTGGTLSGTGGYLKRKNPAIRVYGVEPASSPLLTAGHTGKHGLQGIGANFVPKNYDAAVADEILTVTDADAYRFGRSLARREGLLCGISAGAALAATVALAHRPENAKKTLVVLLPDTGERYLSTPMFQNEK